MPPAPAPLPHASVFRGAALLAVSAVLFATMGVFIRLASHTVGNEIVVFARNLSGLLLLLPVMLLHRGTGFRTTVFYRHLWRAMTGLTAMYGFFYAIAQLPLSSAMIFTYSSPVFIPLVAWVFLKEPMTRRAWIAALVGFIGVLLVCKPAGGLLNHFALIGIGSSLLAATAFVTVRALGATEPATRVVFYFALLSTVVSAVPLAWAGRQVSLPEFGLLAAVGILATLSQLCLTRAYALAPANRIGPVTYLAIVVAGAYAWILWGERPDGFALAGTALIFTASLISLRRG
ncbi:MAG TPA: DMT family transporter [Moraxellaceae bacterium]|nr:DMT family transporter [Moraxellaceae bacterium]